MIVQRTLLSSYHSSNPPPRTRHAPAAAWVDGQPLVAMSTVSDTGEPAHVSTLRLPPAG